MEYKCVDRGSLRCPCALMEAGQCYTCTMSRTGKCGCGESWQGVCPYNEFIQNGLKATGLLEPFVAKVERVVDYSDLLKVIRLRVAPGFAQRCRAAGSYIVVESLGCKVPLSVLKAEPWGDEPQGKIGEGKPRGDGEPLGGASWEMPRDKIGGEKPQGGAFWEMPWGGEPAYIEVAVQPIGPKTKDILRVNRHDRRDRDARADCEAGGVSWRISGPYIAGLVNGERLEYKSSKYARLLVIAKGTAIAPYINIMDSLDGELMVDEDKLCAEFLKDYLEDKKYERVSLYRDFDKLLPKIDGAERIMFLASPYYVEKILRLRPERKNDIIIPNHANICCGVGICGACSYTDEDGVTVRRCKCTERESGTVK